MHTKATSSRNSSKPPERRFCSLFPATRPLLSVQANVRVPLPEFSESNRPDKKPPLFAPVFPFAAPQMLSKEPEKSGQPQSGDFQAKAKALLPNRNAATAHNLPTKRDVRQTQLANRCRHTTRFQTGKSPQEIGRASCRERDDITWARSGLEAETQDTT